MNLNFSKVNGTVTLGFRPKETPDASILLNALFENEKRRGKPIPDFGEDFIKKLATSERDVSVIFDPGDIGIAISFIEVIKSKTPDSEMAEALEMFLAQIEAWSQKKSGHSPN